MIFDFQKLRNYLKRLNLAAMLLKKMAIKRMKMKKIIKVSLMF